MFRNPTSYFLLGLAITDLLTALVQGTVLATLYVFLYLQHPYSIKLTTLLNALQTFTEFCITTSNSTIFAFTLTQFSVVSSPLKYGRLVTRKKALSIVLAIYLCSGIIWFFINGMIFCIATTQSFKAMYLSASISASSFCCIEL